MKEEVKPTIIAPIYLGYDDISKKDLYKFSDGTTGCIECVSGRIGKRRMVWAHTSISLKDMEQFSREHEVLGVMPCGAWHDMLTVFYAKEEE